MSLAVNGSPKELLACHRMGTAPWATADAPQSWEAPSSLARSSSCASSPPAPAPSACTWLRAAQLSCATPGSRSGHSAGCVECPRGATPCPACWPVRRVAKPMVLPSWQPLDLNPSPTRFSSPNLTWKLNITYSSPIGHVIPEFSEGKCLDSSPSSAPPAPCTSHEKLDDHIEIQPAEVILQAVRQHLLLTCGAGLHEGLAPQQRRLYSSTACKRDAWRSEPLAAF